MMSSFPTTMEWSPLFFSGPGNSLQRYRSLEPNVERCYQMCNQKGFFESIKSGNSNCAWIKSLKLSLSWLGKGVYFGHNYTLIRIVFEFNSQYFLFILLNFSWFHFFKICQHCYLLPMKPIPYLQCSLRALLPYLHLLPRTLKKKITASTQNQWQWLMGISWDSF